MIMCKFLLIWSVSFKSNVCNVLLKIENETEIEEIGL